MDSIFKMKFFSWNILHWLYDLFIDGKPSGAIMKLGKYDHDFDWSQSKDIGNDVSQASSHFEKLHSLRQSKKGIYFNKI